MRKDWLRSQCGSEDKCDRNKADINSASKISKDEDLTDCLPVKECKLSSLDSGVGSLSSALPSSQETASDVSVFCNTPNVKPTQTVMQNDTEVSSLMKEAQLAESRFSYANIQMKQSIDNVEESPAPKIPSMALEDPCMICLTHPKTASLIHGTTGHQVCCFSCGKRLRRRGKLCPVCRRPIQKVVRNYIL